MTRIASTEKEGWVDTDNYPDIPYSYNEPL